MAIIIISSLPINIDDRPITLITVPIISNEKAENKMSNINGIFNNSKYARWYLSLIDKARGRTDSVEGENHHIIPESLGGNEMVKLTHREHFIAHLLLRKAVLTPDAKQKMGLAFFCLCNGFNKSHKNNVNARWFALARIESNKIKSESQKGKKKSKAHCKNMSDGQKKSYKEGRSSFSKINTSPRSTKHCESLSKARIRKPAEWLNGPNKDKICEKISKALIGRPFSKDHIEALSKSHKGQKSWSKGKKLTPEQKVNCQGPKSEEHKAAMRVPKLRCSCIECKKEISIGALKRFHILGKHGKPI